MNNQPLLDPQVRTSPWTSATATDVVKGGKFLGEHQRMPLRYDVERHSDPELFSALGGDLSDEDPFGMTS